MCLAVNPPPFDKGGKGVGGLLHFAKPAERSYGKGGGAGQRDGGDFTRVVGMEMFGAAGGASKARMPEMNAQRL